MSQYRAYFVPNGVDPSGKQWTWQKEQWSNHKIKYNPAMTKVNYKAPNNSRYTNDAFIRGAAFADDQYNETDLNTKLIEHYYSGKGDNFDVTGYSIIEQKVRSAFAQKLKNHAISMGVNARRVKCNQVGVTHFGHKAFTKISVVNPFESGIASIGASRAGYQRKCNGVVVCLCNGSGKYFRVAFVGCSFKMYFHDQFADAADVFHQTSGAQEFKGSTQFHVTGAWGTSFSQFGISDD